MTLVDGQKLLTNVTKTFILDAAGVLDMPLLTDYYFEVLFSSFRASNFVQHKSSLRAYFMHARHHTRNLSSPGKFSINAKFPIFLAIVFLYIFVILLAFFHLKFRFTSQYEKYEAKIEACITGKKLHEV